MLSSTDPQRTGYKSMPRPELRRDAFSVRAVAPEHIEAIRLWRNAQMDVLRQVAPISPAQQEAYYAAHVWPAMALDEPQNILLTFFEGEQAIGYGGLVHMAWEHRRAEVSFLLDPALASAPETYARYFSAFLDLIKEFAFDDLGFHRLFTETYAMRAHHISVLEANGFRLEGVLKHHVMIGGRPVDSLIHGCITSVEGRAAE